MIAMATICIEKNAIIDPQQLFITPHEIYHFISAHMVTLKSTKHISYCQKIKTTEERNWISYQDWDESKYSIHHVVSK